MSAIVEYSNSSEFLCVFLQVISPRGGLIELTLAAFFCGIVLEPVLTFLMPQSALT